MNISGELLDEMIEHALEDPGNEVCGVVAVEAGSRPPTAMCAGGRCACCARRTSTRAR
jgi:hypothetical protein